MHLPSERNARCSITPVRIALLIALLAACEKKHDPAPAPPPPPLPPAAGCTLSPIPLRLPAPKRLVAIGDLHGDLGGARAALRAAGAINVSDSWIGGDLVIVQTGDVLDRGDDEQKILELLARLDTEARAQGGAIIQLIGNHELMNAAHDYRYVTPGQDFGADRDRVLGPGGTWAKRFAQHDVVQIVGDTVFSHAGVIGDWTTHVDDANQASRCWLDGQSKEPPDTLTHDDSPVWTRELASPNVDCARLEAALVALNAKRMVVGHTVQPHVTSSCDGKLWRIDVGLAKLYDGPIEVLEITGTDTRVLTGHRE
jgi:hypothetical protein